MLSDALHCILTRMRSLATSPADLFSRVDYQQVLKGNADAGRLHEVPTKDLPKWVQMYFAGTRYFDTKGDHWFMPFEGRDARYPARREAIDTALHQGYHADDVAKVWETSCWHRAPSSA